MGNSTSNGVGLPSKDKIQGKVNDFATFGQESASIADDYSDLFHNAAEVSCNGGIDLNALHQPPIEGLCSAVRELIEDLCSVYNVPIDFVLAPLLATAGTAAGSEVRIKCSSYVNIPNFWNVVVADPGSNKSHIQSLLFRPLSKIDREMKSVYRAKWNEWNQESKASRKRGSEPTIPIPKPRQERVTVGDATTEKLMMILSESPYGLCLEVDELRSFFHGLTRYTKGGGDGARSPYLSLWSNKGADINRVGNDLPIDIADGTLFSICGGIQPDIIPEVFTPDVWKDGFGQRCCFFMPETRAKRIVDRTPRTPDERLLESWDNIVRKLCERRSQGMLISLSRHSNEIYYAMKTEAADIYNDDSTSPFMRSVWAKLEIVFERLMCLAHAIAVVADGCGFEVSENEALWAYDMCRYLSATQERVHKIATKHNVESTDERKLTDKELIKLFAERFGGGKNFSQSGLAKLIGQSQQYISKCLK